MHLYGHNQSNHSIVGSAWPCIGQLASSLQASQVSVCDEAAEAPLDGDATWPGTNASVAAYKAMVQSIAAGVAYASASDAVVRIRPDASYLLGGGYVQWEKLSKLPEGVMYRCQHLKNFVKFPQGCSNCTALVNIDKCFAGRKSVFHRFVSYWHGNLERLADDPGARYHQEWSMNVVAARLRIPFFDVLQ
jgi:hypothetical protein